MPRRPRVSPDRILAAAALEFAERGFGGARVDRIARRARDTLMALVGVPRAFFAIVEDGVRSGAFRPVHPLVAYFSTLAPILFFLAAGRIRTKVTARHLMDLTAIAPDDFVRQLQESLRRA